jgi:DNA-binding MarR family transcriptional regulator
MKRTGQLSKERKEKTSISKKLDEETSTGWTFLSNHSHVIICLARDPEMRLRDISVSVGITERATIRIIAELEEAGYIHREKVGRRNRYSIVTDKHLRHPLEAHHSIRGILALAKK